MVKKRPCRRTVPREKKKSRTRAAIGPAELACRGKREKGCSPFPTGAHAHHGLRDGERLTVSEGRKEAGPFPSDIPRARKPITVDNSQWKEQPWKHTPKNQLQYGPVRYPNTSAAMSSNARFLWESSSATIQLLVFIRYAPHALQRIGHDRTPFLTNSCCTLQPRKPIPARRRPWPTNDGSHANQACSICG